MASLMDNLVDVLSQENAEYDILLELSKQKTAIIVAADLEGLKKITDEEQEAVGRINHLERIREENINDIANVLNMDVKTLKLTDLIQMIADRPEEQARLKEINAALRDTLGEMKRINEHNKDLIETSLEFVEIDLNLLKSVGAAPETANYTKGAYSTGDIIGNGTGSFDAKQ